MTEGGRGTRVTASGPDGPTVRRDTDFYLRELMSDECACGRPKHPRHSFCYQCYRSLPRHMQHDLYQHVGDGYEEAYEAAVAWLEV